MEEEAEIIEVNTDDEYEDKGRLDYQFQMKRYLYLLDPQR